MSEKNWKRIKQKWFSMPFKTMMTVIVCIKVMHGNY